MVCKRLEGAVRAMAPGLREGMDIRKDGTSPWALAPGRPL